MKTTRYILILFVLIPLLGGFFFSCQDDDYNRVFRYYFLAELDTCYAKLNNAVEGTEECLYKPSSKAIYKENIEFYEAMGKKDGASQKDIDNAYMGLLSSKELFDDYKNPYISSLIDIINECKTMLENTTEGTQPGQYKSGAKTALQESMDSAQVVLTLPDLTQRKVDETNQNLILALNRFDANLIGSANIYVENAGFEKPGSTQTNFVRIEGWNCAGMLNTWTTKRPGTVKVGAENLPIVPEGICVMTLGEYSQPVWQRLNERLHANCSYTITYKAKINISKPTPKGEDFETFVRSRIITFKTYNEANPDFTASNIQVVSEKSFSLGSGQTMDNFIDIEHYFRGSDAVALDGQRIAIQFISHEGPYKADGSGVKIVTNSDTWIYIDDVKITRTSALK